MKVKSGGVPRFFVSERIDFFADFLVVIVLKRFIAYTRPVSIKIT